MNIGFKNLARPEQQQKRSVLKGRSGLFATNKQKFGNLRFNNLRGQLNGAAKPLAQPNQITAPTQQGTAGQEGLQKIPNSPSLPPLKPEQNAQATTPPPVATSQVGQEEQPKMVGPTQQEQAMKNQLMPPASQPPQEIPPMGQSPQAGQSLQGAEVPSQDNSAIDQQIAALQKQIADLQAQKK